MTKPYKKKRRPQIFDSILQDELIGLGDMGFIMYEAPISKEIYETIKLAREHMNKNIDKGAAQQGTPVPTPPTTACEANGRQIGGDHYRSPIQHWDYVLANKIDYLEAQVIKYVSRWKKKNGYQDLLKARHFLDKLLEVEGDKPKDSHLTQDKSAPFNTHLPAATEGKTFTVKRVSEDEVKVSGDGDNDHLADILKYAAHAQEVALEGIHAKEYKKAVYKADKERTEKRQMSDKNIHLLRQQAIHKAEVVAEAQRSAAVAQFKRNVVGLSEEELKFVCKEDTDLRHIL